MVSRMERSSESMNDDDLYDEHDVDENESPQMVKVTNTTTKKSLLVNEYTPKRGSTKYLH